jgi:hypothetical protein
MGIQSWDEDEEYAKLNYFRMNEPLQLASLNVAATGTPAARRRKEGTLQLAKMLKVQ